MYGYIVKYNELAHNKRGDRIPKQVNKYHGVTAEQNKSRKWSRLSYENQKDFLDEAIVFTLIKLNYNLESVSSMW